MFMISINEEDEITTISGSGVIGMEQFKSGMETVFMGEVTRYMIWDLTQADISSLDHEAIRSIVTNARFIAHSRTNGKTAILVPDQESLEKEDMVNALTQFADHLATIRIFMTKEEALAWFNEN